jgi:hypothetical protein
LLKSYASFPLSDTPDEAGKGACQAVHSLDIITRGW